MRRLLKSLQVKPKEVQSFEHFTSQMVSTDLLKIGVGGGERGKQWLTRVYNRSHQTDSTPCLKSLPPVSIQNQLEIEVKEQIISTPDSSY